MPLDPAVFARLSSVERAQALLEDAQQLHAETLRRHADHLDIHRQELTLLRQLAERQDVLLQAIKDLLDRGDNGH